MNADRRKEIAKAVALVTSIIGSLEEAKLIFETVRDEEREYYDNMPENMQSAERGEKADQAATILEEIADGLDEAINSLNEIEGRADEASE